MRSAGSRGTWWPGSAAPLPHAKPYPERLGQWPAAGALLGFAWLELASVRWGETPDILVTAVAAYSVVQFWGMAVYGVEPWIERAEGFGVYFNLLSRIGVWERRDGRVGVRRPLAALTRLDIVAGTVAVVVVMIGSVTFDGLGQGSAWSSIAGSLHDAFEALGFTRDGAQRLTNTTGLLASVTLIGGFYALGIAGARWIGGERGTERLRRGFVHSLVPIALVYAIAHYLTFFLFEGQGAVYDATNGITRAHEVYRGASLRGPARFNRSGGGDGVSPRARQHYAGAAADARWQVSGHPRVDS